MTNSNSSDPVPVHRKFGYDRAQEMAEIREMLLKEGVGEIRLQFEAVRIYSERHKNDPTTKERQAAWRARQKTRGPHQFELEELELIAVMFAAGNSPLSQGIYQKATELVEERYG